jgi:DNA repair protein RadC
MSIKLWPEGERPREKLLKFGPAHLSDAELLAIFLRTGIPGKSAIDLAREMLLQFGNLQQLLQASQQQFCQLPGMGPAKYVQLQASLEMSKRFFHDAIREQDVMSNPGACQRFLQNALANRPYEVFACLFLDTQNRVLQFEELFRGTLDGASVYPREVVRRVLELNAASIILSHNHPSGALTPSQADRQLTERLKQALGLIDVRVLDHFIVTRHGTLSFAERGLL